MRIAAFVLATVMVLTGSAIAQPKNVSDVLESIVKEQKLPGMAVLVIQGEQVVARGAAGVRQRGRAEPVQVDDKFHIGSCTKAMTAVLCATLVEEGKLSWTSTIGEVFPELKGKMHPEYQNVTLEQLLTNRGGFPKDLDEGGLWGELWAFPGSPTQARRALLEGVTRKAPVNKPGTEYLYSNAGFSVAGHMAEQVTGKSWEQLMQERVFKPLGMTSAGFGAPGKKGTLDQPRGHSRGKPVEVGRGSDNPPAIGPAGIVHCSLEDWGKFVGMFARMESPILKPETMKKLVTPAEGPGNQYAMGWGVLPRAWAQGNALSHAGSNTMWFAVAWVAPNRKFTVLVACNEGTPAAAKACDDAASAMIRQYLMN